MLGERNCELGVYFEIVRAYTMADQKIIFEHTESKLPEENSVYNHASKMTGFSKAVLFWFPSPLLWVRSYVYYKIAWLCGDIANKNEIKQ